MRQAQLEALYSKRQIHTVLHEAIRYELDKWLLNWSLKTWYAIEKYIEGNYYKSKNKRLSLLSDLIDKKGIEFLLVKMMAAVIHTRNDQTYQQAIGYLQAFLPHEDHFDRAITSGELLALGASDRGVYSIIKNQFDNTIVEVNYWDGIDDRLLSSFEWINATCFNLPLIVPPKEVVNNENCGYHTIQEPLILGDLTYHEEQQNLKAINILNEIEWVLDPNVLAEPEVPSKPLPNQEAHENFIQMVKESNFIYRQLGQDPFWFAWQYDSRGRIYSHGYHVNLQAAEYKKALLNFNHYEELT